LVVGVVVIRAGGLSGHPSLDVRNIVLTLDTARPGCGKRLEGIFWGQREHLNQIPGD